MLKKIEQFVKTMIGVGILLFAVFVRLGCFQEAAQTNPSQAEIIRPAITTKEWKQYPTVEELRQSIRQQPQKPKAKYLTVTFSPYTLFFWCVVAVASWSYYQGWYKKRQEKVDERIFYTTRVKDFIEISKHPYDKTVVARAEERVRKLAQYGNQRPEVHVILYGNDPEFLGEDFEDFQIRAGRMMAEIRGGKYKKQKESNTERDKYYNWTLEQDMTTDWQKVNFH